MKKSKLALSAQLAIMGLCLMLPTVSLLAQDDLVDAGKDEQFNLDELDINGSQKKKSAADRLEQMRRKLEEQNEQMVQKKIEDARIKNEQKLTDQLQDAFNQGLNEDTVATSSSSVQKVEAPIPEVKEEKKMRIIPGLGILNIKNNDIDFESKINANLSFESDINKSFAAGAGIQYASMDVTDVGSTSLSTSYPQFYTPTYYGTYGQQGRQLTYNHMGLNVFGKFYILSERVRPYVGLGLGYNRDNLKYENANQYSYNGMNSGNEEFSTGFVSGTAMVGTTVAFTQTVGVNAEFNYSKGLSSAINSNAQSFTFINPDQQKLNRIGNSVVSASFYSVNLGLVISF